MMANDDEFTFCPVSFYLISKEILNVMLLLMAEKNL